MPSPFPGMDPYLEGHLWPDVHHRLATRISIQLAPLLAPRYVARIVLHTVVEELDAGEAIEVLIPDVEVFAGRQTDEGPELAGVAAPVAAGVITPAPITLRQPFAFEVDLPSVEIRDVAGGLLVASIEILSPVNKRGVGWDEYQVKRRRILQAQAHLLEIDLLRRGRRPVPTADAPRAPYYVFLTRAPHREEVAVWPIQLRDRLPTVPVPLRPPDADVPLDLAAAMAAIYDEARYDLSIDYRRPPDPPLSDADAEWAEAHARAGAGGRGARAVAPARRVQPADAP